jgi:hypothetical protein
MIAIALAGLYLAWRGSQPQAASAAGTGTSPTGADILRDIMTTNTGGAVSSSDVLRSRPDPWAAWPVEGM